MNYNFTNYFLVQSNCDSRLQIASGSYTGTGTYGTSNKNSLTFDFIPRLLIIVEPSNEQLVMTPTSVQTACYWHTSTTIYYTYCICSGNTVQWWNTGSMPVLGSSGGATALGQKNNANTTYHYIAIG